MRKWLMILTVVAVAGVATVPLQAIAAPSASERVQQMQAETRSKIAAKQAEIREQVNLPKPPVAVQKPPVAVETAVVPQNAPTPPVAAQGSVQERIVAAWPYDDAQILTVTKCESGWIEDNVNESGCNGFGCYGVAQISREWHTKRINAMGYTWDDMLRVEPNIAVAAEIYADAGHSFRPWSCKP